MKVDFKHSTLNMNRASAMIMALAKGWSADSESLVKKEVDRMVYEFTLFIDSELEKRAAALLKKNKKESYPGVSFSISKKFEWGSGVSVRLTTYVIFDHGKYIKSGHLLYPKCGMYMKLTVVGASKLLSKTVSNCINDFTSLEVEKMIGDSK